jgi:hypothetical protein
VNGSVIEIFPSCDYSATYLGWTIGGTSDVISNSAYTITGGESWWSGGLPVIQRFYKRKRGRLLRWRSKKRSAVKSTSTRLAASAGVRADQQSAGQYGYNNGYAPKQL